MLDQRPRREVPPAGSPVPPDDGIVVLDLLGGPDQLAAGLAQAVADEQWLDAYLFGAGLLQLVEDRLHPDPWQLRRGADYLRKHGPSWTRPTAAVMNAGATVHDHARGCSTRRRELAAARDALAELTSALAELVLCPGASPPKRRALRAMTYRARATAALVAGDVVRLPACFRSFDQHPEDVRWLAKAFVERHGPLSGRVTVVGVRTSGSYLAPLFGAALSTEGASRVGVLTYRPGHVFHRWERELLRATARADGMVVVTDDPPGTGCSLAATIGAVEQAGVPGHRITLLLSVFSDTTDLPPPLQGRQAVLQPWSELTIHRRLDAGRVGKALAGMLTAPWRVKQCLRIDSDEQPAGRSHAHGRYAVELADPGTGRSQHLDLMVEGAGLGYLGRHALGVGAALEGRVPRIYGFSDGLLYREWLARDGRGRGPDLEAVAEYVAHRRHALPAAGDPTPGMRGRDPVWEVAAERVGQVFGPLAPAARAYLLEPMTRRLLRARHTSVVDGATEPCRWVPHASRSGVWAKVDFHQRAFSHLELACYDAAFDLAGAVADPPSEQAAGALRSAFRRETGETVDDERWLFYRLTQLWRSAKAGELDAATVARRSADAVHEYLADSLLRDLAPADGPLCAIDLDGVLETDRLGYPATAPAGALALRGLVAHGYSPVLVTGRSLTDARDRCATFGLAGAVAEYGAVVYDHRGRGSLDLRTGPERELVARLREELIRSGFDVDPGHQHVVRVRATGGSLPRRVVDDVPLLRDPRLQVVHGQAHSDVTVRRLNKATGVMALEELLKASCVFAAGDSVADLPMLRMASHAAAPSNADAAVKSAGVRIMKGAYQRGLLDACAELLGHPPGRCPVCAVPPHPRRTREVLAMLALPEAGLAGLPRRTLRVAALAAIGALQAKLP